MIIILYIALGSIAGVMAGMLGIGGGLIIVPGLAMIFKYHYGYTNQYMHLAAGTSLAIMIFTAISAMRKNHTQKRVVWPIFWRIIPWIVAGDILGAFFANFLTATTLSLIFGSITLCLTVKMIISALKIKHEKDEKEKTTIHKTLSAFIGSIIGLKSGLLGIGGGAISVPFLHSCGLSIKKATGTSSAFTFPIAIVGTICFMLLGLSHHLHITHTIGYIHWPAALIIIPCTMFFAPIGCTLSYKMSTKWLHIIFILFLILVSYKMLVTPLCQVISG